MIILINLAGGSDCIDVITKSVNFASFYFFMTDVIQMLQVHVTNVLAIAIVFFRILAVATPEAIAEAAIRTKWPHKIHSVPTLDQGNHEKPKPKSE